MKNQELFLRVFAFLSLIIVTAPTHAATVNFSATLNHIFVNTGASLYAGAMVGDSYSGQITVGNSIDEGTPILPCLNDLCRYQFSGSPYAVSISDGTLSQSSGGVKVDTWNEYDLEVEDAATINVLPGISWAVGTPLDGWIAEGFVGANNTLVAIGYISLDTSLYSDFAYRAFPDLARTDLAFLYIEDHDAIGNVIFQGIGTINNTTFVPLPAAVWLLVSGFVCFIGFVKRARAGIGE